MQTTRIDSARAINTVASAKPNTLVDFDNYDLEIVKENVQVDKIVGQFMLLSCPLMTGTPNN